jgi:hypothetical protein
MKLSESSMGKLFLEYDQKTIYIPGDLFLDSC